MIEKADTVIMVEEADAFRKIYQRRYCEHSAGKMLVVGVPAIPGLGSFGWECTQCGKTLMGINPFKED